MTDNGWTPVEKRALIGNLSRIANAIENQTRLHTELINATAMILKEIRESIDDGTPSIRDAIDNITLP